MKHTILVVEDFEPFRQWICSTLQQRAEFQVIEVSDGLGALRKAEELQPDLILLDIALPKLNGLEVARRVRKIAPLTKVLFLSQDSSPDVVREALELGGLGYVHKRHAHSDLLVAIDAVLRVRPFVSSNLEFGVDSKPHHHPSVNHEVAFYADDFGFISGMRAFGGGYMITTATKWTLKGKGYEFCNCAFGCGCNFGGFPSSKDGSCRAFVGMAIESGSCGDVALSGVKCAAVLDWPKAIHEGHGQCVFVVEPTATDQQIGALAEICTGKLGGMPWELLGPTFEVKGLVKARITIEGSGPKSVFKAEGVGEGRGDTFKNPVTGEDHLANIELPDGFIWKKGECGQGTFSAKAGGLTVGAQQSNWILYNFDWANG